jgi:hypothetical protein
LHLLETRIQAIQLSPISRGSPGAPPHTPGHGHRFPGMLPSLLHLSAQGQPSDPEITPPISTCCAGDMTPRLVAHVGWAAQFGQPPSEPGVRAFPAPGSPAIYAAFATGFLPRPWRTFSTTSVSCIAHPSWSLTVHRLCPFTLWTVISGLQIGRTSPRRLLRALRRHRTRVP